MIDPKGAEKKQRPAAADARAAEEAVAFVLFEKYAAAKQNRRGEVRDAYFAERPKSAKFIDAKQRKPNHRHDDADLGEPVRTQRLFDGGYCFHALLKRGFWRERAISGDRRWRGHARRRRL